MNTVFTILAVLVVLASILITAVVLLQNGKGDSLVSNFAAGNQTFGVRQTADILEKVTCGLVAFIFVLSVVSVYTLNPKSKAQNVSSQIEQTIGTENQTNEFPATLPVQENPEQ